MGTPSSIMKIPKFFTYFGILCIVGSINAQSYYPSPSSEPETTSLGTYGPDGPYTSSEAEPGETPVTIPPGERPVEIPTTEKNFCYTPRKCGKKFGKNKEAKGNPCGEWDQGKDCCRCFKNKCTQTKACKEKNGICRMGKSGETHPGLCEGHCGCYDEK